jgi:hypothetical protein
MDDPASGASDHLRVGAGATLLDAIQPNGLRM